MPAQPRGRAPFALNPDPCSVRGGNINEHKAKKNGQGVMVIDYDTPDQGYTPDNICDRCRLAAAKALVVHLESLVRLMDKE